MRASNGLDRALQRVDRERGGDIRGARQPLGAGQRQRGDGGRHLRAVDEREPLLRAERDGGKPGSRQARRAPARAAAPSHTSPSPMRTSAMWASGARSPLAPTDPRLGTRGCTRRLSSARSASSVSRRMPEKPLASTLARSAIDARTARTGSGSSTPAAWLRSRLICSRARSSRSMRVSANEPKPVLTP